MDTLKTLSARAGIEIGGVLVFTVVALITANLVIKDVIGLFVITTFILYAIVIARVFGAIMHFILAPRRPELRLVYTDSWTAQFIERHFTLLAAAVGFSFFLAAVIDKVGTGYVGALRFWLGIAFHIWIILVLGKARHGLTKIIIGDDENLTPGARAHGDLVASGFGCSRCLQLVFCPVRC